MKKAMIIMLTILILGFGGIGLAAVRIYDTHDKVTLTKMTSWGDEEYAEGLEMEINSTYDNMLFWNTTVSMDDLKGAVTEYDFSITAVYPEIDTYNGLILEVSTWGLDSFMINEKGEENVTGVKRAYQELADVTEANEKKQKEIFLKDYMDYYEYDVKIDLPGTQINSLVNTIQKASVEEQKKDAIHKMNDFFKIPVLETESWSISLEKDDKGYIVQNGSSSKVGNFFHIRNYNALTEKECYFTFNSHSVGGEIMDTSLIPGGYGIYCLPYDDTLEGCEENSNMFDVNADRISVDTDGLKMVYSLDPQIDIMLLHLNEKKDKLILHAKEYGKYVVTIIDVTTMETLQKIEVMDWKQEYDYGYQIYNEGDFIVTVVHKTQEEGRIEAVVLEENEQGKYEVAFICDIQNKELPSFNTSVMYLDFDGKRLAMAGFLEEEEPYYRESSNLFLAVCNASGMKYYGEYRNSLESGFDADLYSYQCRGYGFEPIVLKWEE